MIFKTTLALTGLNLVLAVAIYFVCWKWGHKLKLRKPILIDELAASEDMASTMSEHDGRWYVAKPMPFFGFCELVTRINHAYLVIIGKASCYQYHIDRIPKVKR